jgi:hypothetical protein
MKTFVFSKPAVPLVILNHSKLVIANNVTLAARAVQENLITNVPVVTKVIISDYSIGKNLLKLLKSTQKGPKNI